MGRHIWKFGLRVADRVRISMPVGSEVMCVQMQGGVPRLWVLCGDGETEEREFFVVGTGHEVPVGAGRYVGTIQECGGRLVWHVFEGMG